MDLPSPSLLNGGFLSCSCCCSVLFFIESGQRLQARLLRDESPRASAHLVPGKVRTSLQRSRLTYALRFESFRVLLCLLFPFTPCSSATSFDSEVLLVPAHDLLLVLAACTPFENGLPSECTQNRLFQLRLSLHGFLLKRRRTEKLTNSFQSLSVSAYDQLVNNDASSSNNNNEMMMAMMM